MSGKHDVNTPVEPRHRGKPVFEESKFFCHDCDFEADGDHYRDAQYHEEQNPEHYVYEESIY